MVLSLIAATTTSTGLSVESKLESTRYPTGLPVSDAVIAILRLELEAFRGQSITLSCRAPSRRSWHRLFPDDSVRSGEEPPA
jgi:hypothetical protein